MILAAEENPERDSDEEDDEPSLLVDLHNYPILPARGNMTLTKSKSIRLYWTLTYSEYLK